MIQINRQQNINEWFVPYKVKKKDSRRISIIPIDYMLNVFSYKYDWTFNKTKKKR